MPARRMANAGVLSACIRIDGTRRDRKVVLRVCLDIDGKWGNWQGERHLSKGDSGRKGCGASCKGDMEGNGQTYMLGTSLEELTMGHSKRGERDGLDRDSGPDQTPAKMLNSIRLAVGTLWLFS